MSDENNFLCDMNRELNFRENLLQTGEKADCEFIVGLKKVKFRAHRFLLNLSSAKIKDLLDKSKGQPIVIKDIEPEFFEILLKSIYSQKIVLQSVDLAFELAKCAHSLDLVCIRDNCLNYISKSLTMEMVIKIFDHFINTSTDVNNNFDNNFLKYFLDVIKSHTKILLNCTEFLCIKPSSVAQIFSEPELNLNTEIELVAALHKYAHAHDATPNFNELEDPKNKKFEELIVPALKHIRFLTIPLWEIYHKSVEALLPPKVMLAITAHSLAPDSQTASAYPKNYNSTQSPRFFTGKNKICQTIFCMCLASNSNVFNEGESVVMEKTPENALDTPPPPNPSARSKAQSEKMKSARRQALGHVKIMQPRNLNAEFQ